MLPIGSPDQPLFLRLSMGDWLFQGHLGRFARIVAVLDLSAIVSHWDQQDGCGKSACPRFFLVRLLVYA